MMKKLPQTNPMMTIAEGIFIEVMHMLVEQAIVTEKQASARYEMAKKRYKGWG